MDLTYEQKKAYDDYMDALIHLYKLMLPDLQESDLNNVKQNLHELADIVDEDTPDIAPWIFEYRQEDGE